jgi:hypothetical protein
MRHEGNEREVNLIWNLPFSNSARAAAGRARGGKTTPTRPAAGAILGGMYAQDDADSMPQSYRFRVVRNTRPRTGSRSSRSRWRASDTDSDGPPAGDGRAGTTRC